MLLFFEVISCFSIIFVEIQFLLQHKLNTRYKKLFFREQKTFVVDLKIKSVEQNEYLLRSVCLPGRHG